MPEQWASPIYNGEFIIADLVGAGLPFDVVTYGRFVNMDLGDHDIIFLSGHTSPTTVSEVYAKCQAALSEGRKIFINGELPYMRFSTEGVLREYIRFGLNLFDVQDGGLQSLSGTPTVPPMIEKDPVVTAVSLPPTQFNTFLFTTQPDMTVKFGEHAVGFLYPQGGAIDGYSDHTLHLLDYGKIANYLRYGNRPPIGFANDRIEGTPIVSIEIHADLTNNLPAIDALEQIATQYNIKMTALLVYNFLTPESIEKWNNISPLFSIGSHSRSHHWDWTPRDIYVEVISAVADQRTLIPRTIDYFNFSGMMNPTLQQIEQLYPTGILFGARGADPRNCKLPSGEDMILQGIPIKRHWFQTLAQSTTVPFCLSQTMPDDITLWLYGYNYYDELRKVYQANLKYGLYTYGFIHDLEFAPDSNYYTDGVPLADLVRAGIAYMVDQGAKFIPTEDLVRRLRDFIGGRIFYTSNPDGSVTVTAIRPEGVLNEIKVGVNGDRIPYAYGESVVSQHQTEERVYITLKPETTSTITIRWLKPGTPPPPVVTAPKGYISNASVAEWEGDEKLGAIDEYQYAVGTQPGSTDALEWTSAGTSNSAVLTDANLTHGETYYISVRARYSEGNWSDPGSSEALIADLTPPPPPSVTDDGVEQISTSRLRATWTASDSESGISCYQYAVGTSPGSTDIRDWTLTEETQIELTDLNLTTGETYYISVKACNGSNLWGLPGVSDGIYILPCESVTIGTARRSPDGRPVHLSNGIVTAVFQDEFYIEDSNRAAGIKILSNAPVSVGDIVEVKGKVAGNEVERFITNAEVTPIGSGAVTEPIFMCNYSVAGAADEIVPGATGSISLNNVGLLITTTGRIKAIASDHIYISDGSVPREGATRSGIKVLVSNTTNLEIGMLVAVTGISNLEKEGETLKRVVRARAPTDIAILAP